MKAFLTILAFTFTCFCASGQIVEPFNQKKPPGSTFGGMQTPDPFGNNNINTKNGTRINPMYQLPGQQRSDPSLGSGMIREMPRGLDPNELIRKPSHSTPNENPTPELDEERFTGHSMMRGVSMQQIRMMELERTLSTYNNALTTNMKRSEEKINAHKNVFIAAYNEMKAMSEGKAPYSLKRAVFLTENAYYGGSLNYAEFCRSIKLRADTVRRIMLKYRLDPKVSYDCNLAIQMYMDDTIAFYNGKGKRPTVHYPMRYDFVDPWADSIYEKYLVTKLIRTHTGQCHTMPLFYKLMADEIGAKASITYIPNHSLIMFQDNLGKWHYYETTSGIFPSRKEYEDDGYVTVRAKKYGLYLNPLTEREHLAHAVGDLALAYQHLFHYGEFTWICAELESKIHPRSADAAMIRYNTALFDYVMSAKQARVKNDAEAMKHPTLSKKLESVNAFQRELDEIGYVRPPDELYQKWRTTMEQQRQSLDLKNKRLKRS